MTHSGHRFKAPFNLNVASPHGLLACRPTSATSGVQHERQTASPSPAPAGAATRSGVQLFSRPSDALTGRPRVLPEGHAQLERALHPLIPTLPSSRHAQLERALHPLLPTLPSSGHAQLERALRPLLPTLPSSDTAMHWSPRPATSLLCTGARCDSCMYPRPFSRAHWAL